MEKSKSTLTVEWNSLKNVRHKAVFKKGVVGSRPSIKVMVETWQGSEQNPCRVEIGLLGDMLPRLFDACGRYRLMMGMTETFAQQLEAMFDCESDEDLTDFGYSEPAPLGHTLHPVFQQALRPYLNRSFG